jgi:hypothetical protein
LASRAKAVAMRRVSPSMVVALLALVIAIGGVAVASIPGPGGVIKGCYNNTTGTLRVIDSAAACDTRVETALSWNQTGPKGAQGAPGPAAQSIDQLHDSTPSKGFRAKPRKLSKKKKKLLLKLGADGEPTDGFQGYRNGPFSVPAPDDLFPTVVHVDVPAGRYLAHAVVEVFGGSLLSADSVSCQLVVGQSATSFLEGIVTEFGKDQLLVAGRLKKPGRIELRCTRFSYDNDPSIKLQSAKIVAVRLAKLTSKPSSGGP